MLVVLLGSGSLLSYFWFKSFYLDLVSGKEGFSYFELSGDTVYLQSSSVKIPEKSINRDEGWERVQVSNFNFLLPTTHPFYQILPLFHMINEKFIFGVELKSSSSKDIASLQFLDSRYLSKGSSVQKIFELPLAKKVLAQKSVKQLWSDLFELNVDQFSDDIEVLIYQLFIVDLRSRFFPPKTKAFGLITPERALVELESTDKDYRNDLVLINRQGHIVSYIVRSHLLNSDAQKMRDYYINNIKYQDNNSSISEIIYKEFKQLPYEDKVAKRGMTHLFSAWSSSPKNPEYVQEMVFYLEKGGEINFGMLNPIYEASLMMFEKTFTQFPVALKRVSSKIFLQRKKELEVVEQIRGLTDSQNIKDEPINIHNLPDKQRAKIYLEKAKKESKAKKSKNYERILIP